MARGGTEDCPLLGLTIVKRATIKVMVGPLCTAPEIERFIKAASRDPVPIAAALARGRNGCMLHVRDGNGRALVYVYFADESAFAPEPSC